MSHALVAGAALSSLPLLAVAQACSSEFQIPAEPPEHVLEYNGIEMQEVCFLDGHQRHAFIIGDWGGVKYWEEHPVQPADKRSKLFPSFSRRFVHGVDDQAQQLVAKAMSETSTMVRPDYVINVGDNFYWGGVDGTCGGPPFEEDESKWSDQWKNIYENIYRGNMLNIPWLGVMGNHDYGGYMFSAKWAQVVGYTWARRGRWLQPAMYWGQNVRYNGFTVAYYFVDTNAVEAWHPDQNVDHNLCSSVHNEVGTCGDQGPKSIEECHDWFWNIWWTQWEWLNIRLAATVDVEHKIIVTHYPPKWFSQAWQCMSEKYGINVFISGHIHHQAIMSPYEDENYISGACTVVSGGGGGITSEGIPSMNGEDDQYGFVDMQFEHSKITLTAISHGQKVRKIIECPTKRHNLGMQCNDVHERRLKSWNSSADFWDGMNFI